MHQVLLQLDSGLGLFLKEQVLSNVCVFNVVLLVEVELMDSDEESESWLKDLDDKLLAAALGRRTCYNPSDITPAVHCL